MKLNLFHKLGINQFVYKTSLTIENMPRTTHFSKSESLRVLSFIHKSRRSPLTK